MSFGETRCAVVAHVSLEEIAAEIVVVDAPKPGEHGEFMSAACRCLVLGTGGIEVVKVAVGEILTIGINAMIAEVLRMITA